MLEFKVYTVKTFSSRYTSNQPVDTYLYFNRKGHFPVNKSDGIGYWILLRDTPFHKYKFRSTIEACR